MSAVAGIAPVSGRERGDASGYEKERKGKRILGMDYCKEVFENYLGIHDPECLEIVRANSRVRRFLRREVLLREGDIQTEIPFQISGSHWCYYIDEAGKQRMECLASEKYFPMTPLSDLKDFGRPSPVYMETLEETEAYCVPLDAMVEILTRFPEAQQAMGWLLSRSLELHRLYHRWTGLPNVERYRCFRENFPELERLRKCDVAAVLDMSPSALSKVLKAVSEANESE